jgi:methyltransferase (TIGR00027 family)
MNQTELFDIRMSDVSETSLLTLYCHALESQSSDPIMSDPNAVDIMRALNQKLSKSKNRLHKKIVRGKIDKRLVVHIAIRAKRYDEYVIEFLKSSPDGVVVNIGCGLDSRFSRIDNGRVRFYDLDLPDVIEIKRRFFEETDRYHFIPSSVLDYDWMSPLLQTCDGPFLFVAEGVFMYLHKEDVKSLVVELQSRFPGSELVCEVFNDMWLKKPLKGLVNFKMRKELHLGKDATFHFGIRESKEMEEWNPGITFLDDWSYFDSQEKKLGWLRLAGSVGLFRKTQWTVHYRLNGAVTPP